MLSNTSAVLNIPVLEVYGINCYCQTGPLSCRRWVLSKVHITVRDTPIKRIDLNLRHICNSEFCRQSTVPEGDTTRHNLAMCPGTPSDNALALHCLLHVSISNVEGQALRCHLSPYTYHKKHVLKKTRQDIIKIMSCLY